MEKGVYNSVGNVLRNKRKISNAGKMIESKENNINADRTVIIVVRFTNIIYLCLDSALDYENQKKNIVCKITKIVSIDLAKFNFSPYHFTCFHLLLFFLIMS